MIPSVRNYMPKGRGFSLTEVIVVVAILTTLALLAVPAMESMLKGSRVTIAGTAVVDELNLAQQTAQSRNVPVEVRFFMLPSVQDGVNGAPSVYRGMQSYKVNSNGALEPVGKMIIFPQGIIAVSDNSGSKPASSIFLSSNGPLADAEPKSPGSDNPREALPNFKYNYKYVYFRYKGDGGTDLNQVPTYLTLISDKDPIVNTDSKLPANFVTVQIDPVNGRTRVYRP